MLVAESDLPTFDRRKILRLSETRVGYKPSDRDAVERVAETLSPIMTDNPHAKRWADWFRERGLDLDMKFAGKPFAVFLPAHDPPWARDADDDERLAG
ncbi:hypothetical protein EK403_14960 [Hansschlegelia zhihuaiae]|uniref:Uncharacterized protein n=1 Tax=Hansschlegelia zhihuaiae TaxID=405005 RepID=A0A4Q0MF56_9HYPH|nr:hypothetical protein EK403_14960 [Hansschlegelia zhihuaiae]